MPTPLINALRIQGGTFYTFTSAAEDISRTFTDDDARFVFSKFVLLDLPDVQTPSPGNYENYIVWEGLGSYWGGGTSSVPSLSSNENINFAQSFQNYVLNFEQLIIEGTNNLAQAYDSTQLRTVSERLFWKWLANINAIRFRNATAAEAVPANRYTESNPTAYYKRVVKYIGDIDVVNSVAKDGHSYSEVYLNVPTTHGSTPVVLFKTFQDPNYAPGVNWVGGNYIDGRDSGSIHPTGLDLRAYYDDDNINAYISEPTFGDISNWTGTAALPTGTPKPVLLSRMDGAVLDFDSNSYKAIVDDPTISILSEFNAVDAASDFSFNAALVYYDTYSSSNPSLNATNLYGVLILDDYVNQGAGYAYLKRFDKFKPNKITKLNGNSYGLKLNLKFDTSVDNAAIETIINDYNTFSMDLFIDASTRMQEAANMFLEQEQKIIDIRIRLSELEQYYFSQDDLDQISQRLSALETSLNNAKMAFSSSTTIIDLINQNADNINQILTGALSVNLTYNTDVLKNGDGVILDKSVPNQVKVNNRVQSYFTFNLCKNTSGFLQTGFGNGQTFTNVADNNILVLGKFGNYFRQSNTNPDPITGIETLDDTLYINIEDKTTRWRNGQTLRIVFNDPIDSAGYNIVIRTDSEGVLGGGAYGKIIGIISSPMLISNKPIFEVVCTDENAYNFNVDIIR